MSIESVPEAIPKSTPMEGEVLPPVFTIPPVAGFWRRLAAWLIDSLLLGIFGQIVGLIFAPFWFQAGSYGRFFGLGVIFLYFGIQNSKLCNGQTVGKRLMRIAVRDANNQPIGLWKSAARILLLAVPAMLNGWNLPILQNPVVSAVVTVIFLGLGGSILYTMVFNRGTRQGLHDLICGTYVVHMAGQPVEAFPKAARIHWIISGVIVGLSVVLLGVGYWVAPTFKQQPALAVPLKLYEILKTDDRFISMGVQDQMFYSNRSVPQHLLIIQGWYKGKISLKSSDALMTELAGVVMENVPEIDTYDGIKITLTSAYDLGIASAHISFSRAYSIEDWRKKIEAAP